MAVGWMPDGSEILALAWRFDGVGLLAVLPSRGGDLPVLKTFDARAPALAAISPDGRFMAYDLPREKGSADRDIYILAADGSRESQVVGHPATDTVVGWNPAGDRLLFLSDAAGEKPVGNPELLKRGLEVTGVVGTKASGALFYSLRASEGDVYIAEFDPASGKARGAPVLVSASFPGTHSKPEWSPDGRKLAYISARGRLPYFQHIGGKRLRIRDLATGQETEQHFGILGLTMPRWSPQGNRLIVEGHDAGQRAFFLVDLASGTTNKLRLSGPGPNAVMVAV